MAAATTPRMARSSASEMPIHQPKNSRSASAAQAAAPPVAASEDRRVWNRVWIRLQSTCLFLWDDEDEVSAFGIGAGFRLGGCARGEGEHGGPGRLRFQPPAVVEKPPWQSHSPDGKGDDFRHAPSVPGAFAAHMRGAFRSQRVFVQIFCSVLRKARGRAASIALSRAHPAVLRDPPVAAVTRPKNKEIAENPDEPVCHRRFVGDYQK
jgi:hypothetical protein